MRFLVTAGNTREPIDQVRDWGNIFTGNTGLAIARALSELGPVDLLTSNRTHLEQLRSAPPAGAGVIASSFTSHQDLKGAIAALLARQTYDAVFMTAAVADYRPVRVYRVVERNPDPMSAGMERWIVQDVQAGKVRSTHKLIAVLGEPTEKLIDLFRTEWGFAGLLVKFKLEVGPTVDELVRIGQNSRLASGADYLVANSLEMVGGEKPGAFLLWEGGQEWVPREALASRMVRLVRESTKRPPSR